MGWFSDIFGGGGSKTVSPFDGQDRPFVENYKDLISGLFNNPDLAKLFSPNSDQKTAEGMIKNINPNSYFAGANTFANSAGGTLDQAKNSLFSDMFGANSQLSDTIGGKYLSPESNPFYNNMVGSATDAAQKFLNKNFGNIEGATQRASGGVGTGSNLVNMKSRSAENVASDLGGTLANIQSNLYNTERGNQEAATGRGLQLPIQQAQTLGTLGNAQTSLADMSRLLGSSMFGANMDKAGKLFDIGSYLQGQNQKGFFSPFDMMQQLINSLRGSAGQGGAGILPTLTSNASNIAQVFANPGGFSTR